MKIGLFFGSFNPVHVGHLVIADFMATQTDLDRVWLVVSPQNPLKLKKTLARDQDRLHLVKIAIEDNPKLRASDVEFSLPKPSFTIDTLAFLREKHPEHDFALIMGGDNLASFHLWKNYETIFERHLIYVYKRPKIDLGAFATHPKVRVFDAPMMDISATMIRDNIQNGKSVRYLLTDVVREELEKSRLYKIKIGE
jgi:nicotinate-nucleotide adenylyltransferase